MDVVCILNRIFIEKIGLQNQENKYRCPIRLLSVKFRFERECASTIFFLYILKYCHSGLTARDTVSRWDGNACVSNLTRKGLLVILRHDYFYLHRFLFFCLSRLL